MLGVYSRNDVDRLSSVIERAEVDPEVLLEATYGWYSAVGGAGASGTPVGGESVGVPAGQERCSRRLALDTPAACPQQRRRQRPGRYAVGLRPSLDPVASSARQGPGRGQDKRPADTLDRPRSFTDDPRKRWWAILGSNQYARNSTKLGLTCEGSR
jgi:hypothetical protein